MASAALPTIKLQYFNIQGVTEKVRLALTLGRIPFEDERVPFDQWGELKPKTPYGQLPLMHIDGGEPMAQSDAMLRYAGKLATERMGVPLYPSEDMLQIEEALGLVGDMSRDFRNPVYLGMNPSAFGYSDDFKGSDEHAAVTKAIREKFMAESFPQLMGYVSAKLAKAPFIAGGSAPTIADCALVPVLNRFRSGGVDHIPVDCLSAYPDIIDYLDRFMALPEIKTWYESHKAY